MHQLTEPTTNLQAEGQAGISVRLLGSFEIRLPDGAALGLGSRKAQALFAYLAMAEKPTPRETLTLLLWPEMAEQAAKNNLRTTLTMLKRQLATHLEITSTTVAIDRHQAYFIDVERFQHGVNAALDTKNPVLLQGAIDLYQGEFLQGFHLHNAVYFEEWLVQQRERLHLLMVRALETRLTVALERREYATGLAAGHRLLAIEPWLETAYRYTMQLLALSGEQSQALRLYERCCQVLETELDVAPSAETAALYEQIRRGAFRQPTIDQRETTARSPRPTAILAHNLQTPLAAFIGRQTELAFIEQRLHHPNCRLLTIMGQGGIGKSALALAAAHRLLAAADGTFPDGIFWIPLADISSGDQGPTSAAAAANTTVEEAILRAVAEQLSTQPTVSLSSPQQLQTYLRSRRLLLILDNFEHLLPAAQTIVTLLGSAPEVKALITSRARLTVRGENILLLKELSLPSAEDFSVANRASMHPTKTLEAQSWQKSDAITMFVQRAQQVAQSFTLNAESIGPVSRICQLVGGLPLGIELATSLLPLLSCEELANELASGLMFLAVETRDLPPDQRTLAAVFERSWRLLTLECQQILARLTIFPGSFRRDAAQAIVGASDTTLQQLLNQSLLNKIEPDRYSLHRTIYEFAWQKLQQWSEQIPALHVAYARFYLSFVASMESGLIGSTYREAMGQIRNELENVHTAWRRGVTHRLYCELEDALAPLFWFYEPQGFYLDLIDLYEYTLHALWPSSTIEDLPPGSELAFLIARVNGFRGPLYLRTKALQKGIAVFETSWRLLQREKRPTAAAACLAMWGRAIVGHDAKRAKELLAEALTFVPSLDQGWQKAFVYLAYGESLYFSGDYVESENNTGKGFTLAQQRNWQRGIVSGHKALGRVNLMVGRYQQAEEHLRQSIAIADEHHFKTFYVESMIMLGEALMHQGYIAEARECLLKSREVANELGMDVLGALALWKEGCLAELSGEHVTAKELLTQSLANGLSSWWIHDPSTLGWALVGLGELAEAQAYFQQVYTNAEAQGRAPVSIAAQAGLAYLAAFKVAENTGNGATHSETAAEIVEVLRRLQQHPSATQQTRTRIGRFILSSVDQP